MLDDLRRLLMLYNCRIVGGRNSNFENECRYRQIIIIYYTERMKKALEHSSAGRVRDQDTR